MVKHIILWEMNDSVCDPEKVISEAKEHLEALVGVVEGLVSLTVRCEKLPSSSADLMLESTFVSEEALRAYKDHPAHVAAADGFVRPFMSLRLSFDFEE